ncbi:hypothetical protein GII30_09405 [Gordonia amarae]|uniref:Uncharacterized protein n=1 Tax=Gordonia amarae TaxID=36821 RepID=A0A857KW23_9ACTN|nr:hypothetical protein [Gordonia amarae]MCS3878596.1 hypothetical protein [Gordonia amarae]QHN17193.1 hypothetical protein GII35_09630 [Gordonia amarae]QHN21719.1 hypothetical protein GII34_09410 [Gordonia amarae]QHN30571.1 hypothetical protein GII32_09420 [Gordonia amarae]QHN39347.1 hypothetical protein GII30_09405 [Gordonia amarae]
MIAGAVAAGFLIAGGGAAHAAPVHSGPGTLVVQESESGATPQKKAPADTPSPRVEGTPDNKTGGNKRTGNKNAGEKAGEKVQDTPDFTTVLKPGPPMPVSNAEYSYLATHAVTKQLKSANIVGGIAALPVPAQYRAANDGLAFQFRRALDGALSTPGGCIQIVVSRGQAGSLFNYGLFAVEGQYCS